MNPTHLDLFSGIGGFAIAAQACGYRTIGFCEKEPYAQQILKERFGAVLADADCERCSTAKQERHTQANRTRPRQGDIGKHDNARPILHSDIFTLNGADYAGVDLLTGGFPCQPFSVAGKRRGKEDDRAIWPEMLRVIDGAKPAWLIGENVAGIVTMELDNILSDLEGLRYTAWPLVIPACAVDARHRRDRVWIVAHADGTRLQRHGETGNPRRTRKEIPDAGAASCGTVIPSNAILPDGVDESRNELGDAQHAEHCQHGGNHGREDVADAMRGGQQGQGQSLDAEHPAAAGDGQATQPWNGGRPAQWLPEPELGRVAHGIPHRAHRLRGLGNAIVPQVAKEIIRAIRATTTRMNDETD